MMAACMEPDGVGRSLLAAGTDIRAVQQNLKDMQSWLEERGREYRILSLCQFALASFEEPHFDLDDLFGYQSS
jgi:hypothetical protein